MSQLIPEEVVQEVLLRADITDVISDYVLLKKSGANAKGLCPFHTEKTPSFTVSPAKGLFYCFGCQASGNALRFLMRHENMTFPEAVRFLAARYGVRIPENHPSQQSPTLEPLYALHQAAATFFHTCLMRDPAAHAARSACRQRQITNDMAVRFGLGYAPPDWETLCRAMQQQGFSRELLVRSGLAASREAQGGVYDRFRHRLIFPITDRMGRPVAFGGRTLEGREAVHVPKYLNSPETPIFQKSRTLYGFSVAKQAIRQQEHAILVEGYTDVIACHRQGIAHVVGTLGTALTASHVTMLKGLVREIILIFDGDAAGAAATERGIGLFLDAGVRVRVVTLPEGEDPDSFLRQHTGEELLQYVQDAMSFLDFLVARLKRFMDLRTPAGQADAVARLLPFLRKIDNHVERSGYMKRLADALGVPLDALQREVNGKAASTRPPAPRPASPRAGRPPRATPVSAEYTLIQLLCHNVRLLDQVRQQIRADDVQDADLRALYLLLCRVVSEDEATVFPRIFNMLDDTVTPTQERLLSQIAMASVPDDPTGTAQAVRDCIAKIQQRPTTKQRQQIIAQLRAVDTDDIAQEHRLLQEYNQLRQSTPTSTL